MSHCKETWCGCFSPLRYKSNDLAELAACDAPPEEFFPRSPWPKRFIHLVLVQIRFFPFPPSSALSFLAGDAGSGWDGTGTLSQEPMSAGDACVLASLSQPLLGTRCVSRECGAAPASRGLHCSRLGTGTLQLAIIQCLYCYLLLFVLYFDSSWKLYCSDFFLLHLLLF